MLETTCRIVRPGPRLYVLVRRATVAGSHLSADLLERACGRLRHHHGLAAVRCPDDPSALLVATDRAIAPVHLADEEWELDVTDAGEPCRRLTLDDAGGAVLLPALIERAFLVTLARRTDLWTLDSPRIWHEAEPFLVEEGIAAYRRYEVGAQAIDGAGVGVTVDVGTAFFTVESLAYFFDQAVAPEERARRIRLFEGLTRRQEGQKGTLLYDNGRSRSKCYFEAMQPGVTVSTTGRMRVKGRSYDSLLDYYRAENPALTLAPAAPAARVSFPHIRYPQPVAAEWVRVRVMNDDVPDALSSVDKIAPRERRHLLRAFWGRLGPQPLGRVAPGFADGFWRPEESRIEHLLPPDLTFGRGQRLAAPAAASVSAFRANYRQRAEYLEKAGCYAVPPAMVRTLHCAYPDGLDAAACRRLGSDIAEGITKLTGHTMTTTLVAFDSVTDGVEKLRAAGRGGMALFILNGEPNAYFDAAFGLPDWRVKRITERTLARQHHLLTAGAWDRKARSYNLARGKARWDNFILLNALGIVQLLDAIPFRLDRAGPYEAQLVIDVGHDGRHFALSLLIAREGGASPAFALVSHVHDKPERYQEAINPVMLADQIVDLFGEALRRPFDPVASLLVLRDGRVCGREGEGIERAVGRLVREGRLSMGARVDVVDVHKGTQNPIRLWEVGGDSVENPLEGTLVRLDAKTAVLAATGAATLHQGTADPLVINGNGHCHSVVDAARAVFAGAQLNWSSPSVAQRLPQIFRRADDELEARAAQEVRRFR